MQQEQISPQKGSSVWQVTRHSFAELKSHDPLRMAGATAFFTTFALPPIIIILFQLFSLFFSRRMVGSHMMEVLTHNLGPDGAKQLRETSRGFRTLAQNWYTAIAGFVFLVFVATTLFTVIKNTLNEIWEVRSGGSSLLFKLQKRAKSLSLIIGAGILFLMGIMIDTIEVLAGNSMDKLFSGGGSFFKGIMNEVVGACIVTTWFVVVFRYLADARPSWKASLAGGALTGILFSAGKVLLSYLLRKSNISIVYGASGSIVLILLFVFYSSFILYFGASFIKIFSASIGRPIRPLNKAYRYQLKRMGK
jgi:membrane protein